MRNMAALLWSVEVELFNSNGILTFVSSTSKCHVCLYFAIILVVFTIKGGLVFVVVCLFVFSLYVFY